MATTEELQQIFNLANELNQNVAKQQTEINAKNMREIVETQIENTRQILETFIKELATVNSQLSQNEGKKILLKNLEKPKKFFIPSPLASIDRFVKDYRDYINRTCGPDEGAHALYLRSFLDGPAAIWYDGNVDDKMDDNFDAVINAMKMRFERESYKAFSYIPIQDNKTVTEFYDELLKIGVAQCWSADRQLELFRTGIADWYKLSLDVRCPKTLTEAYNMALIIEADKTDNINIEETNKKMVQMMMETVTKLNAAQKALNEKEVNDMRMETYETNQAASNDANRLQMLENSITQISAMLFNIQNQQQMTIAQNCLTQQAYPCDYSPHCPQPAEPFYELPQDNSNPRYHGRNYPPAYVPKHLQTKMRARNYEQTQNQDQENWNQEN